MDTGISSASNFIQYSTDCGFSFGVSFKCSWDSGLCGNTHSSAPTADSFCTTRDATELGEHDADFGQASFVAEASPGKDIICSAFGFSARKRIFGHIIDASSQWTGGPYDDTSLISAEICKRGGDASLDASWPPLEIYGGTIDYQFPHLCWSAAHFWLWRPYACESKL